MKKDNRSVRKKEKGCWNREGQGKEISRVVSQGKKSTLAGIRQRCHSTVERTTSTFPIRQICRGEGLKSTRLQKNKTPKREAKKRKQLKNEVKGIPEQRRA